MRENPCPKPNSSTSFRRNLQPASNSGHSFSPSHTEPSRQYYQFANKRKPGQLLKIPSSIYAKVIRGSSAWFNQACGESTLMIHIPPLPNVCSNKLNSGEDMMVFQPEGDCCNSLLEDTEIPSLIGDVVLEPLGDKLVDIDCEHENPVHLTGEILINLALPSNTNSIGDYVNDVRMEGCGESARMRHKRPRELIDSADVCIPSVKRNKFDTYYTKFVVGVYYCGPVKRNRARKAASMRRLRVLALGRENQQAIDNNKRKYTINQSADTLEQHHVGGRTFSWFTRKKRKKSCCLEQCSDEIAEDVVSKPKGSFVYGGDLFFKLGCIRTKHSITSDCCVKSTDHQSISFHDTNPFCGNGSSDTIVSLFTMSEGEVAPRKEPPRGQ